MPGTECKPSVQKTSPRTSYDVCAGVCVCVTGVNTCVCVWEGGDRAGCGIRHTVASIIHGLKIKKVAASIYRPQDDYKSHRLGPKPDHSLPTSPTSSTGSKSPAALFFPQMAQPMDAQVLGGHRTSQAPEWSRRVQSRGQAPSGLLGFLENPSGLLAWGPLQVRPISPETVSREMYDLAKSLPHWSSQSRWLTLSLSFSEKEPGIHIFVHSFLLSFGRAGNSKDSCCESISKETSHLLSAELWKAAFLWLC